MKNKFLQSLQEKVLICDGAMGTLLIQEGLTLTSAPEELNLTKPELIKDIHKRYIEAGADIILCNTFGASSVKLSEFKLEEKQEEIISKAVAIAKEVATKDTFIVADIGPLGKMVEPLGPLSFDEAVNAFKEEFRIINKEKVDAILIETMSDIKEIKAAVIAAKEETDLPVWVQLTFDENKRTLHGTPPEVAIAVCEGLGVDIIGMNCSLGPKELYPVVKTFCEKTNLLVSVQPNAGLPILKDGETVYELSPVEMNEYAKKFIDLGVNILGGCCGTTPEHIKALFTSSFKLVKRNNSYIPRFASRTKTVDFTKDGFPLVIGERINPTARKKLTQEILNGKTSLIKDNAREQVANGADLLDLNVGVGEGDEAQFMEMGIKAIENVVDVPIVIDTTDINALERGLKACSGRPLINSVNGKQESMEAVLPLAKKYGALVLILPVDEEGIPKKADERFTVAKRVVEKAISLGIKKQDLIVDGIVLTVSTNQEEVKETLIFIKMLKKEGLKTVLGVSNISYGLPSRTHVNTAFLSQALMAGLDMGIINPNIKSMMDTLHGASVLTGRDSRAQKFIRRAQAQENEKSLGGKEKVETKDNSEKNIETLLKECILFGNKEDIVDYIETALEQGIKPMAISLNMLIPALEEVGEKFGRKEYFLPQLIMAAETIQNAFTRIKKEFSKKESVAQGKILLATVEGDVHDIGKNIVNTVLESHGYTIYDLGTNATAQKIVDAALENKVDIIGLSALMTTTMQKMEETIHEIKEKNLDIKIILGGAVVTAAFSEKIGAHGYGKDALEAVSVIKKLLKK